MRTLRYLPLLAVLSLAACETTKRKTKPRPRRTKVPTFYVPPKANEPHARLYVFFDENWPEFRSPQVRVDGKLFYLTPSAMRRMGASVLRIRPGARAIRLSYRLASESTSRGGESRSFTFEAGGEYVLWARGRDRKGGLSPLAIGVTWKKRPYSTWSGRYGADTMERARRGEPAGLVQLGLLRLAMKDTATGVNLIRRSAQGGNPLGQFAYACLLITGRGVSQDIKAAMPWIARASNGGLPAAQRLAGDLQEAQSTRGSAGGS